MIETTELPDDIATLKAMLFAAQARNQCKDERIDQLKSWSPRSSRQTGLSSARHHLRQ